MCKAEKDLTVDFGIQPVLVSVWIFVDESGPKRPTGERPDTHRRQGAFEDPDALPRPDPGPARARRVRHERDRRVRPHLSDGRVAGSRAAALEDARQPSLAPQVPRSRQLL